MDDDEREAIEQKDSTPIRPSRSSGSILLRLTTHVLRLALTFVKAVEIFMPRRAVVAGRVRIHARHCYVA